MPIYEITGEYDTQGPQAYDWGGPEQRLKDLLADTPGVDWAEIVGSGTVLTTGLRDAQIHVETQHTERAVMDALDKLPGDEANLWTVEQLGYDPEYHEIGGEA